MYATYELLGHVLKPNRSLCNDAKENDLLLDERELLSWAIRRSN